MADSMDSHVWTTHAVEQWEENKTGHSIGENDPMRKWLLELKDEVTTVVDLGCGGALWRQLFYGFDYTGVDQNLNMITYARKRWPEDKFIVAPGEATTIESGSVDLVFTAAVLQHNLHPRKSEVVKEIHRIIKPNGYYYCTENTFREDNYHHSFPDGRPFSHDLDDGYSFTAAGWLKYMNDRGFDRVWYNAPSEYMYRKKAV